MPQLVLSQVMTYNPGGYIVDSWHREMKYTGIIICLLLLLAAGCTSAAPSPAPATPSVPEAAPSPSPEPAITAPAPLTPASFSLANLTIQPVRAQPGEAVTITVDIVNIGGTEGTYTAALMINGVKEADKRVTITAGGTRTVSFTVTNKNAASYNVVVDGVSGSFTVVAAAPAPVPLPVTPKKDQPFEWVSDITPGSGKGTPPPMARPGDDGPWNYRIMSASSRDGLTWVRDNIIIADQASVPDAIVDKEGNIRIYYVDWYNGHRISAALSHDGTNWIYKVVTVTGQVVQPGELDAPADPDIVLLPDGNYRLYYMYKGAIYSAISSHGIDFTKEEGTRFQEMGRFWTDPDVCKMGDVWRMFVWREGETISTVSNDGLSFKREYALLGVGIQCTIPIGGGYRMYYPKNEGIFTAFSKDGVGWVEEGLRLEGAWDPAVIRMQDGTYKMFYKIWIPPEKPPWLKP